MTHTKMRRADKKYIRFLWCHAIRHTLEELEEPPGVVKPPPAIAIVSPKNDYIDPCIFAHSARARSPWFVLKDSPVVGSVPGVSTHEFIVGTDGRQRFVKAQFSAVKGSYSI
jgi:hypothetical protein